MAECGAGNQTCLVRELSQLEHSQERDAMLIETYRAMGQSSTSTRLMQDFVRRYPDSSRTRRYRQLLGQ